MSTAKAFTLEQIRDAHAKVKSGADFPAYVQELKALGIAHYEHFVADGRIRYTGIDGFSIDAPAKWPEQNITAKGDAAQLKTALEVHQQGGSDYFTFCQQSAAAGVEKWTTDMQAMRCSYYSQSGAVLLEEIIPG
ncbi:MAG: DUF1398 domain-containing protein [Chitinophagaceae bacterium]|nr:DUF1398 domain-containing protein [Chitinophagaceae bacterium]